MSDLLHLGKNPACLEFGGEIPKVSVIIPAYNCREYISETLQSLKEQAITHIEVVIVNDGSSDGSEQVIEQLVGDDPRFRLITQPNSGVASARNRGLEECRGEYIYCLDSDDVLEPQALKRLVDVAGETGADLVHFNSKIFRSGEGAVYDLKEDNYLRSFDLTGDSFYRDIFRSGQYRCPVWLYLIRRDLLDTSGIRFIPGIIHEDEAFTLQLMLSARKQVFVAEALHWRQLRPGSIMSTRNPARSAKCYLRVFLELASWISANQDLDPEEARLAARHIRIFYLHALRNWLKSDGHLQLSMEVLKNFRMVVRYAGFRYSVAAMLPGILARPLSQ